jgi:hypothetical protein
VALYSAAAALVYGRPGHGFNLKALQTTAVMSLACALAQDILPRSFKEAVVFWRFRHRLPSHRAFLRKQTDRYDLTRIANHKQLAELPPSEQQLVFYNGIYKKHRNDPTVAQCNFRYCAWRDTASLFLLLALVTVPAAYSISIARGLPFEWKPASLLAAGAAIAYLLTALAARQVANSFVGLVLACETAEPPHGISW